MPYLRRSRLDETGCVFADEQEAGAADWCQGYGRCGKRQLFCLLLASRTDSLYKTSINCELMFGRYLILISFRKQSHFYNFNTGKISLHFLRQYVLEVTDSYITLVQFCSRETLFSVFSSFIHANPLSRLFINAVSYNVKTSSYR